MKEHNKGIIYIAETIVSGLIKIGKTKTSNFEQRMYQLEHNGYCNVVGLKRVFAIEVDNYHDKEALIHEVFEKSKVGETELFALNIDTAIQLLSSFEGKIIYPKEEKTKIFEEATEKNKSKLIPDGIYTLTRKRQSSNEQIKAQVKVQEGNWILLKGSQINKDVSNLTFQNVINCRATMKIDEDGKLLEDLDLGVCTPSFSACVVLAGHCNGWKSWKNKNGDFVDIYRKNEYNDEED